MDYRAYLLSASGHIEGCETIECGGDAEAIEQAAKLVNDRPIELWNRDRFVIRLAPEDKTQV